MAGETPWVGRAFAAIARTPFYGLLIGLLGTSHAMMSSVNLSWDDRRDLAAYFLSLRPTAVAPRCYARPWNEALGDFSMLGSPNLRRGERAARDAASDRRPARASCAARPLRSSRFEFRHY